MKINQSLKNIAIYLLKISITAGLLIFLFKKTDINKMISIVKDMNLFYLSIAIIIFVFTYYLGILRWQVLLKGADVKVSFSRVTISYLMGLAINLFSPSTVGGDLARGIDLSIYASKSKPKILATVILDRIFGYVAIILIASFSLIFGYKFVNDKAVIVSFGILALLLLAILLILFSKNILSIMLRVFGRIEIIKNGLMRFHDAVSLFRLKSRLNSVIYGLFLSLVIQFGAVLLIYFLALALKIDIDMVYFFVFVPIINAISMIPITIGGLGLRDSSAVFFFTRAGLSASAAFTLSLMTFLFFVISGIIGGIIYVFTLRPRRI